MASIFKPTYTKSVPSGATILEKKGERFARFKRGGRTIDAPLTKDGAKIILESSTWHVRYKGPGGSWQRQKGYTDKDATLALGVRLERAAARGIEGLDDPFQEHNRRPLVEHLAEFRAHLEALNDSPGHVQRVIACCSLVFSQCGFERIPDISASRVEEWLTAARKKNPAPTPEIQVAGKVGTYREIAEAFGVNSQAVQRWKIAGAPITRNQENDLAAIAAWRRVRQQQRPGLSIQTSNQYLTSLKHFTRWLVRRDRLGKDPLADLAILNNRVDRRHDRRALDPADFYKLLDAAEHGPVIEGIAGPDRAMLYLLAGWSGFRRKELASLTKQSFDLESVPATVTVQAGYSKNKRKDSIPLHPVIVARLQSWFAQRPDLGPTDPVFRLRSPGGSWRRTGYMMQSDLKAAGIPYCDEAGLYADFHSNRHTFISNLGRAGVPITMAQKLARHSTPALTANVYTHLGMTEKADAICTLPPPEIPTPFQGALIDQADRDGAKKVAPGLTWNADTPGRQPTTADNAPRIAFPEGLAENVNSVGLATSVDENGQQEQPDGNLSPYESTSSGDPADRGPGAVNPLEQPKIPDHSRPHTSPKRKRGKHNNAPSLTLRASVFRHVQKHSRHE
jgi:integrase